MILSQPANCSPVETHSVISHLNLFCELQWELSVLQSSRNPDNGNGWIIPLVNKIYIVWTLVVDAQILFRAKQTVDVRAEAAGESGSALPDNLLHYRLYLEESLYLSSFEDAFSQMASCLSLRDS